jgi:DNA-binding IclR family transcriptional regulator
MATRRQPLPASPEGNVQVQAKKGIGSVDTAVGLLRIIESSPGPVSLTQIARTAGFQLSKTHHYLVSMVRTGLVSQESGSGLYSLGRYALQIGVTALGRTEAGSITAEAVRRLRDDCGHTTCFSLWGDRGPLVVHSEQGLRPLTVHIKIGTVLPLFGSATSDVFLAWMPETVVASLIAASKEAVSISARQMAEIRARIRRDGLAHQSNTRTPNVAALAAPVFSKGGSLAGVMTSIGFLGEFDENPGSRDARILQAFAKELSQELGFRSAPA